MLARVILALSLVGVAHADEPKPDCGCPPGFELKQICDGVEPGRQCTQWTCTHIETAADRVERLTRALDDAKMAARLQAVAVKVNRLNARKAKH